MMNKMISKFDEIVTSNRLLMTILALHAGTMSSTGFKIPRSITKLSEHFLWRALSLFIIAYTFIQNLYIAVFATAIFMIITYIILNVEYTGV